ncbi:MAG: site-specific integrase, partial [Gemmataceae bacterium]|nr:site-specific integrase [Gemmataceae bacterium]
LHRLYGHTPAAVFGPRGLAAVRQEMVNAGTSRKVVNQRVGRITRALKWAASQELVPVSVYQSLRTLQGLQSGRTEAPDTEPIKPVPAEHVRATLPHLTPHLRCLAELQLLTGIRPNEVCQLRLADVDRTGGVWLYRPQRHKTRHRGRDRVVALGPKAQSLIEAFTAERDVDPEQPLFSPDRAQAERFAAMRAARKTKVQPSQAARRARRPKRSPGSRYTPTAYSHAVAKAAKKAGVPHWHPNQIRHTFATSVRKAHGLEAAQVLLGHARADVTQVYAERDMGLAIQIAQEVG